MVRGIEKSQEQAPSQLIRDTRTLSKRVSDFFKNPMNVAVVLVGLGAGAVVIPGISDVMLMLGLGCFIYTFNQHPTLPFRMPLRANTRDYNDIIPGTHKANMARGICFIGNDIKTNEELWFSNEDMRTHMLIFGSTGSGKTEALVSIAFNALVQGSGFIYVDGKGDNALYAKVFSMVRSMGRDDDMLLINFMTGARDIVGAQEKRLSNTMNPFSNGSSSMLAQLVVSMMDSGHGGSDGDMWKGRAIVFVEAIMKILVYMRDEGHILLDANSIRNYFEFPRLEAMVMDKQFIRDKAEPVNIADAPEVVVEPINNYVKNLPGYDPSRKGKQVSQVLEQHGFITMQLTRAFGSLADTYGHIIRTNLAEVDVKDVVLNRRILVVLLPALEKSPEELANLGKIIIASLKAMMAAGLGEGVEGTYQELIKRKPTNAPTPYICVLDEYGYYAVPGFAVVPAQARSLGFCAIFAGQDLPAFQKASKEEAASIGANTNVKVCMKLEDPTETWEFFTKTAGEAYVTKVDSFQTDSGSVTNNYLDTRSASAEKRSRIDLLDLKDQREGEAHIFFKSTIVRARMFYANPAPVAKLRLNHFLKVEAPEARDLVTLLNRMDQFDKVSDQKEFFANVHVQSEDIDYVVKSFAQYDSADPIEQGVNALLAFHNRTQLGTPASEVVDEMPAGELNVFARLTVNDDSKELLVTDDLDRFAAPLLLKSTTQERIGLTERVSGKTDGNATNIASDIVNDMQLATHYPPLVIEHPEPLDLTDSIRGLISTLVTEREKKASGTDELI